MSDAESAPQLEEKVEVSAVPTEEAAAAAPVADQLTAIVSETVEAVAEVVEQAADVVEDITEAVGDAAEKVIEVAEEVAEEIKASVEEAPAVVVAAAEEISAAPLDLIEDLGPVLTFVEPAPAVNLVEAVKAVAPQKYADLGKEARDLITKDFVIDNVNHLKATTKSANGFQLTVEKNYNHSSGVVGASLETKYTGAGNDWSIATKCNTDSLLSSSISVANQGLDGLNVDIDTSYSLVSGKKSMKVKTAYTGSSLFHPTLDLDVADVLKPNIDASLVLAHEGFHAGYQTSFDSSAMKFAGHNVSVGYKMNDLFLTGAVENASKVIGSVYYNIKEGLAAAAHLEYASGGASNITVCGKYDMGSGAYFKAKIDKNLNVGLSYTTMLRPGLSLKVSQLINQWASGQGGNRAKVGVSLDFES